MTRKEQSKINEDEFISKITKLEAKKRSLQKKIKKLEERMAESPRRENLCQGCLENIPVMVYAFDKEGKCILWNKESERVTGYRSAEVIGQSGANRLLYPDDKYRAAVEKQLHKFGGEYRNLELEISCRNGRKKTILWSSIPDKLKITGCHFLAMGMDITDTRLVKEELKKQHNRMLSIFDGMDEVIYVSDPDSYELLYLNGAARKRWGDAVGKRCYQIIQNQERPCLFCNNSRIIMDKPGMTDVWEHCNQRDMRWYRHINKAIIWPDGRTVRYEMAIDINDLKETEKKLLKSEKRLKKLANLTFEGILIHQTGLAIDVNKAFEKMFGYQRGELIGLNLIKLCIPKKFHNKIKQNMFKAVCKPYEVMAVKKDGTVFPIEIESRNMDDELGEYRISAIRDLTESKRINRKLKENEEYLRSVFLAAPTGIGVVINRKLHHVNRRMCEMVGYTEQELIGQSARMLYHSDQEFDFVGREKYRQIGLYGTGTVETRLRCKDGRLIDVLVSSTPLDIHNFSKGVTFTALDISARKRAEEEKIKLEDQLRRSQKLETIGTLAGGIAHDFNNILTPILGYSDMILNSLDKNDPIYEDLKSIKSGSKRAKDLVDQILTFSRQLEQKRRPLQLHLMVREVVKFLRPSIPATIEIRQRIDSSTRKVLADPAQIHQILMNLCTNAFQAIKDGKGTITIELKNVVLGRNEGRISQFLKKGEYVRLSVYDTGIGMDESVIKRVFEPFFTTKSVDQGTGMGLSVVHGIVRSYGGDVVVESEPDKGSAFHVYLPVVEDIKISKTKTQKVIKGGNESLMIIDDEEMITRMLEKMLDSLGYSVEVKNSSSKALDLIKERPDYFDLIITDLTMPKMTGKNLADECYKIRPDLPVILMTGYSDKLFVKTGDSNNIRDQIEKPVILEDLASSIRRILDKKE